MLLLLGNDTTIAIKECFVVLRLTLGCLTNFDSLDICLQGLFASPLENRPRSGHTGAEVIERNLKDLFMLLFLRFIVLAWFDQTFCWKLLLASSFNLKKKTLGELIDTLIKESQYY